MRPFKIALAVIITAYYLIKGMFVALIRRRTLTDVLVETARKLEVDYAEEQLTKKLKQQNEEPNDP